MSPRRVRVGGCVCVIQSKAAVGRMGAIVLGRLNLKLAHREAERIGNATVSEPISVPSCTSGGTDTDRSVAQPALQLHGSFIL